MPAPLLRSEKPGRRTLVRAAATAVLILVCALPELAAQTTPDIKQTYAKLCSGCHGADAHGTQQGPGLAGNAWLRRRSIPQLRKVIRNGVPSAGMPPFDLPGETLDGLAALVASLNASAADSAVPGNRAAGKEFFFGKGQCATCHMAGGRGEPIGPDLSNLGRQMTVEEIREALLDPSAKIAEGYGLVTLHLRDGEMLRGFARARTNFDIQVQDLKGVFHPLALDQISSITEEKQSLMPALKANAGELEDLIAYLSGMTGVQPGATIPAPAREDRGISFQKILNPPPGDWLTYNGNLSGNRYSELKQINRENVNKLGLKWTFSIPLWAQFFPDTPYYRENMRYYAWKQCRLWPAGSCT